MNQVNKIKQTDLQDNKWYSYHEDIEYDRCSITVTVSRGGPYGSKKEATGCYPTHKEQTGIYSRNSGHSKYMTGKTAKENGFDEWELDEVFDK